MKLTRRLLMLLAILLTLFFGLIGVRYIARILHAPKNVLMTAIAILCVVGSYAVRNSIFDVVVMIAFGAIGWLMHRVHLPAAPVVFGLILGPLLEENVRRALIVSGDWTVFFTRPISATLIAISMLALLYPAIRDYFQKRN